MKRLLYTLIIGAITITPIIAFNMPSGPGNFQIPDMGMPTGGPGQMAMPSQQELAEVTQYLENLQQNDPEQLKELERMGHEMIASLNPEELNEFSAMFGVDPEELRQEAERFLAQEEHTTQPEVQPETYVDRPVKKAATAEQKTTTTIKTPEKEIENAKNILHRTITAINLLRAKGSASPRIESHLRVWEDDLTLLLFYLNILNKNEHFTKLPSDEKGKKIIQTLQSIEEKLARALPLIDPTIEDKVPNEYAFFNFTKTPTKEELETAFEKRLAEHDPKKLETTLQAAGKNARTIKREIKLARIAQASIEDEYERLADPKNRAELQKQELKIKKEIEETHKNWALLLTSITKEFGNAFFEQALIANLEEYLAKYEPEELKKKKEKDQAIKAQEKAQQKAAKIKPTKSKGGSLEPRISYAKPPRPSRGGYGDSYSGGSSYSGSSDFGGFSDFNTRRLSPSSGGGSSSSRSSGSTSSSSSPDGTSGGTPNGSTTPTLAETARSVGEKTAQKELTKTMNDFSSGYRKTGELFAKVTAGISDRTSAREKTQKLTDFLAKDEAIQLITTTDRLATTTEHLTKLADKNKAVKTELKKFFKDTVGGNNIAESIELFTKENTLKDKPAVKTIGANLKKIQDLLKPYKQAE